MGYGYNGRRNMFTEANLKQYGAVVFLNTTGNILNDEQQLAFQTHTGRWWFCRYPCCYRHRV
jgi:hypothetical protein